MIIAPFSGLSTASRLVGIKKIKKSKKIKKISRIPKFFLDKPH
jgi:hypothetical protein